MCGPDAVDGQTAAAIAAAAATFREVTASPFGPDDQIGMLNLITPESMRAVVSRADAGHTLDLSVDYFIGMPSFTAAGQPPYQIGMTNTPAAPCSTTRSPSAQSRTSSSPTRATQSPCTPTGAPTSTR